MTDGRGWGGPESGRIVTISIIRWRPAFWTGLVVCAPLTYLFGTTLE